MDFLWNMIIEIFVGSLVVGFAYLTIATINLCAIYIGKVGAIVIVAYLIALLFNKRKVPNE